MLMKSLDHSTMSYEDAIETDVLKWNFCFFFFFFGSHED